MPRTEQALSDYEARSAPALIGLAFAFLGLYAAQVLWLAAPPVAERMLGWGQLLIWAVFIIDFTYRVFLAPRRLRYVAGHPLDLITLILPMLRPLRALRIFAAARVLIDRGHYVSYGRVATAITMAALFIIAVGALVVLDFERPAEGGNITGFGDALWWAAVTLASVGYGDLYPITGGGRASAVAMMAVGMSLLGAITATFAAWFTQRIRGPQEDAIDALRTEISALREQVSLLIVQQKQPPPDRADKR